MSQPRLFSRSCDASVDAQNSKLRTVPHWLMGQADSDSDSDGSSNQPVFDPATGQAVAQVPMASAALAAKAVAEAAEAAPLWAKMPAVQRARIMFRYRDLLVQHTDALAALITQEHGKVHADARGAVQRGIEVVEFACGIPALLNGAYSEGVGRGVDCHARRQPLGVCLGVTPFNFPAMVPLWMFPVALVCGNTFVLKPSEQAPSVVVRMAELLSEAGCPPGVLQVVHGDGATVAALLEQPAVQSLSFVGSTPVAEVLYQKAAARGIRAQCLGGAKNHMVVMPDAPLPQVVDALMGAAFGSAGERCMAISVAVAVGDVGDALVEVLAAKIQTLKVGPGDVAEHEMGPLISAAHKQRVCDHIQAGVDAGATLVVDGRVEGGMPLAAACGSESEGYFLGGSLFDHVQPEMSIYQEEIFGPVLAVVRVPDLDAALALIAAHRFGNGTSIFTRDGAAADAFASQVDAGMVGINIPIPVPMAFHSFGGWKKSLLGDTAMHGPEGVRFFTRLKTITSRWPKGHMLQAGADFNMPV